MEKEFKSDRQILLDIDRKVDAMRDIIHVLEIRHTEIQKDLEYHIKRTDILQSEVMYIQEKIKPIDAIRFSWTNILKLVTLFAGLSSIAGASLKFFK